MATHACPRCKIYQTTGFDFCCRTCRDSFGTSHGTGCARIPVSSHTTTFGSKICPKCNTYEKNPSFDFCCRTCRDSHGTSHGMGCCRKQASLSVSVSDVCPKCRTHKKNPGKDFCCLSCRDSHGSYHGKSCTGANTPPIGSTLAPCTNLRTGAYLYDPSKTICFYDAHHQYYEFTNFYSAPISHGGIVYPTSEHFFQAQKFINYPAISSQILSAPSPREAFDRARAHASFVRSDWHSGAKDQAMLLALELKFSQHSGLKKLLVSTGDKLLVEHTTNDDYWGDNGDGSGKNQLGQLLMWIRDQINSGKM
jgi:N-glycosidase YbiA